VGAAAVLRKSFLQGLHLGAQDELLRPEDLLYGRPDITLNGSILRLEVEEWNLQRLLSEKLDSWG
jgi:hypothetical protein